MDEVKKPKLFPHQESIMRAMIDRETLAPKTFFVDQGTGRVSRAPEMQTIRLTPRVIRQTIADTDFAAIEQRILASLAVPEDKLEEPRTSDAAYRAKLDHYLAQMRSDVAARYDQEVTKALFAAYICPSNKPKTREERIRWLLGSADRRQRKRGARMIRDDFRRVFGTIPANWNSRTKAFDWERSDHGFNLYRKD